MLGWLRELHEAVHLKLLCHELVDVVVEPLQELLLLLSILLELLLDAVLGHLLLSEALRRRLELPAYREFRLRLVKFGELRADGLEDLNLLIVAVGLGLGVLSLSNASNAAGSAVPPPLGLAGHMAHPAHWWPHCLHCSQPLCPARVL